MVKKLSKITIILLALLLIINQNVQAYSFYNKNNKTVNKIYNSNNKLITKNIESQLKKVPNELIIKYKKGTTQIKKEASLKKVKGLQKKQQLNLVNSDVVKLPDGTDLDAAMKALKENSNVEFVQPNYIYYPAELTSDTRSSEQWGLQNTGQVINGQQGTAGIDIDIKSAWNITKGSSQVIVGIIDSGIDINHPELKDKLWKNPGEIPGNGVDDDHNGYVDDINGWNFYGDNSQIYNAEDGDSHGTHVAGIIAAALNGIGVAGIAPDVSIMPLKFIGPYGGTTTDAIAAIEYAKKKGVKILNMSWGNASFDAALKEAIENSGCLVVAAAGNNGENIDTSPIYPAAFNSSNILSVAALDNKGSLTDFSNYGLTNVDVAAPGQDILSTVPRKTLLGAAVASSNGIYKTLLQGFGMESIASGAERKDLMSRVLSFFGVSQSDAILLIQDDESSYGFENILSYYKNPLQELGFNNVTVYNIGYLRNGPGFSALRSYKLVIWATGEAVGLADDNSYIITETDQRNIKSYLDCGGMFYVSGENIAYNLSDTSFIENYLHAKHLTDEYNRRSVSGMSGTFFEGKSYNLNTAYEDIVKASDSSGQVVLAYDEEQNYNNAYEYFSGTSMAAPFASGVAALLLSYGVDDPLIIKQKIIDTSKPLQSLSGKVATGGMINAAGALASAKNAGKSNLFQRLWGANRYETAVSISKYGWKGASNAVLTTGADFPDALSAAPLARKYNAPILLTERQSLTPSVEAELDRLGVKNVFIIGGEGVVSKAVEDRLRLKNITFTRLGGVNRYETSLAIANYLGGSSEIVVATGRDFPDALSIASYAAFKNVPILLTETNSLYSGISDYIRKYGVNKAYVIGGYGVVSDFVLNSLPNGERIAGNNRYETNTAVLNKFSGEFDITTMYFATGQDFPDALAGSVLAAATKSPIVLLGKTGASAATSSYIKGNLSRIQNKQVLGGEGAVSSSVMNSLLQ
ncbi:S8 family serine peptidase [Clostridium sp. SYSU_GA19001]|uniref:cell wall-binding repeat-containing protein n=1 Tax=Clostridium caldaquaticum TaxID=2940653 RepID=UPI002076F528|nr:cell wall-binding repeat-containing protein [Clostridium caldaquaticum]MCM8710182.1 S8 family serine peptidase [Clostridium caldaquaticum]